MFNELLAYLLVPVAVLATWAYQWLAARARRWLHEDIRADQLVWWVQDHYRGSVAVPGDVETHQPAADSRGSESAAGLSDRANPSRRMAAARTNPATGPLPPAAGPQQPVGVGAPRHGADRCSTPQPGDPGGAGAVVPQPTAPARSAA